MSKINHMTDADHDLVTDAVAQAELHTSGEIVTIVADMSDRYGDIALAWATFIAFFALAFVAVIPGFYLRLLESVTGGWHTEYSAGEYLVMIFMFMGAKWLGSWLILKWMPLRLFMTPRHIKRKRVHARAIDLFKVGTEAKTVGRTGVLLYLSMREHRAEIVADEAISTKVDAAVWGDAMVALLDKVKAGQPGEGMAEAVRQMGIVLAEHFPNGSENPNELPDRLIEL